MCYIDDGEYCDVWRESKQLARKQHKCCCCLRPILPGEQYYTHFSVYEGDATTAKLCMDCFSDRDAFSAAHGGYIPNPVSFLETLSECIGEENENRWQPMLDRIRASRASMTAAIRV